MDKKFSKMKKYVSIFIICILPFVVNAQDCIEGINLLPMYGNAVKCKQQKEADERFFSYCDQEYPSRKAACKHHVEMGWKYFNQKDYDTAMKRFNQAWMLDNRNAGVYWGFGVLLGEKKQYEESIEMFDKSLAIDSSISNIWLCLASSYNNMYLKTHDKKYISTLVNRLKDAVITNPKNKEIKDLLNNAQQYEKQIK